MKGKRKSSFTRKMELQTAGYNLHPSRYITRKTRTGMRPIKGGEEEGGSRLSSTKIGGGNAEKKEGP